jgi:hypothetical protein
LRIPNFLEIVCGSEKNFTVTRILDKYFKNIVWPKECLDDEEYKSLERM